MTVWSDNFDDNVLDLNKWQKTQAFTGTGYGGAYERNQRLELEAQVTDGYGGATIGIVSRDRYDLTKGKVSIYLRSKELYKVCLCISPQKTTGDPDTQLSDVYGIWLASGEFVVLKKIGGESDTPYRQPWIAGSNVVRIEIEAGFIRFYEGDICRYYEPYQLPSYECYIYIYGWGGTEIPGRVLTGIDWADDFYCEYCRTAEEKQKAQTLILQQKISEFLKANWVPLSVLAVILAIVFSIILGVW